MIANILRGRSRPDQDLTMAILTELIQTGLGVEGQLQALYTHMVSVAQTAREQEVTIHNLSRRLNESLANPSTPTTTSLASTVEQLEARTVILGKEKKDVEAKLEKTRKAILRGPTTNEEAIIQWRDREKKLTQDFNTTLETRESRGTGLHAGRTGFHTMI